MVKEKTRDDLFLDPLKGAYLPLAISQRYYRTWSERRSPPIRRLRFYRAPAAVLRDLDKSARGKTCDAIERIIAEGEEIMEEFKNTPVFEVGLISAAQAVDNEDLVMLVVPDAIGRLVIPSGQTADDCVQFVSVPGPWRQ